jgi:phage recombination protein Bet
MHVAQRTGLDPFAKQIYMIGRNVVKQTIQTGIDGFRLVARRSADRLGETLEYEDTEWCGNDGVWADVWTHGTAPAAARVVVIRNGRRFPAVALYREYVQTKSNGEPNAMWSKMPANQLAKCAEALALRKAYPQDLSGLYTDDEMGQADRAPRGQQSDGPTSREWDRRGAAPRPGGRSGGGVRGGLLLHRAARGRRRRRARRRARPDDPADESPPPSRRSTSAPRSAKLFAVMGEAASPTTGSTSSSPSRCSGRSRRARTSPRPTPTP